MKVIEISEMKLDGWPYPPPLPRPRLNSAQDPKVCHRCKGPKNRGPRSEPTVCAACLDEMRDLMEMGKNIYVRS